MPKVTRKKKRRSRSNLGKTGLRELELYAENTYSIYRHMQAFALNYAKKKATGKYNRRLAIKGLANNLVPAIVRSYKREFGSIGTTLTQADKNKLAQMLLRNVTEMRDYILEHERHKLPKKYQKKVSGKLAKKKGKRG